MEIIPKRGCQAHIGEVRSPINERQGLFLFPPENVGSRVGCQRGIQRGRSTEPRRELDAADLALTPCFLPLAVRHFPHPLLNDGN